MPPPVTGPQSPSPARAQTAASEPSMGRTRLKALLQSFATDNHVDGLTPSEDGLVALTVNDTRVLLWCQEDENAAPLLLARAELRVLPKDVAQRVALCEALLLANTSMAYADHLGVDAQGQVAVLQRVLDLDRLDAQGLGDELADMLRIVAAVKSQLLGS